MPEKKERVFEDAEQIKYGFDKQLTFKLIVLQHVKKIGEFASVEFRGGYFDEKTELVGGLPLTKKVYVPDTREVYNNAVDYLADLLFPRFDTEMRAAFVDAEKKIGEISKEQDYRHEKRKINRVLFRELCCFLFRKKYLEIGSAED